MRVFELLQLLEPGLKPEKTKIHLATSNGQQNPLDVYFSGEFPEWQRWQSRRNFERRFVVSLIALPSPGRWLFAGAYVAEGSEQRGADVYYQLHELVTCTPMAGRLVAVFDRPGRQSYLLGENWSERILLGEIRAEPLRIVDFPGYRAVDLSRDELETIVRQSIESWKAALSSVAGVYLISDTRTGRLYVGSASGEGGIWQRWQSYAANGHGGNVELKQLLQVEGAQRAADFRYAVLEIADLHDSQGSVLQRESHWKRVLMSREHGLNSN